MVFGMFTRGQIQWNSPWTSQLQWFYYQDVLYGGEFQILIPGYMVMVIIYIIYIYILCIYIYIWNFGFMTIWDLRFLQIHGNPNGLHHVLRCHKARSVQCSSGTDLDCSGSKPATSQCLGDGPGPVQWMAGDGHWLPLVYPLSWWKIYTLVFLHCVPGSIYILFFDWLVVWNMIFFNDFPY